MGFLDIFKKKGTWVADPNLKTIAEMLTEDGDFTTLTVALKTTEMTGNFSKKGPFTVFAPNNSAFIDLPPGTLEGLLKDKARLKTVLSHHVAEGGLTYQEIAGIQNLATIDQKTLAIDTKGLLKVGGANIIRGNIKCKNGYIQVLDKVLVP